MAFCCLCHALHYTSSPLHSLSYYITSFNSNHMYDRLKMYLMSSATRSLTVSLHICPCFFLPFTLWPGSFVFPEQNQRRVLGLWRHASCCSGHRQQAGDLIAVSACFFHQAAERHGQNSSLRKCWKDWLPSCHPPTWCMVSCVRPKIREINLPAIWYFLLIYLYMLRSLRYKMWLGLPLYQL